MTIKSLALAAVAAVSIGAASFSGAANAADVTVSINDRSVQAVTYYGPGYRPIYRPGHRCIRPGYIVPRYVVRHKLRIRGFHHIRGIRLVRRPVYVGRPYYGYRPVRFYRCRAYYVSYAKRGFRWYKVFSSARNGRPYSIRPLYRRFGS